MHRRARQLVSSFVFLAFLGPLPFSCKAQDSPDCGWPWIAPGQLTVTPAQVIGAPAEHLQLRANHPAFQPSYQREVADDGYIITGDKVDLITTCNGYAYVRFHGAKRVSTGWVEKVRIQKTGDAYIPRPPNTLALCQAAEDALNENHATGALKRLPLSTLPPDVLTKLHIDEGFNPKVAHVKVDGRAIALVNMDTGGTCHSSKAFALTDNLKERLTPNDIDDRNPRNTGSDGWSFGVMQSIVEVLGRPMVLSTSNGGDTSFYLSLIDKNGDIVPTCHGQQVGSSPEIQSSADDRVCHAMLSSNQIEISMSDPAPDEKLVLSKEDKSPLNFSGTKQTATTLIYPGGLASVATYTLEKTGLIDVDNSGHPRRVGIVTLADENSTAGCGDYSEHFAKPVYLDDHGVADPDAALNKLFDGFGEGMSEAAFVKFDGKTYLKLEPARLEPSQIWKFDSNGAHQICTFQLQHYEVGPV